MKFWSNTEIPSSNSQAPEKRLLAAVLQRAITDYVSGDGDLKEGARAWMFDEDETDAPLSFKFICEALDLEIDNLRRAIFGQAEAAAPMVLTEAVVQ